MKRVIAIVAAAGCLWIGGTAAAQGQTEQAKTYFNAGAQAYDAGQYAAAAQAFEEAYKLAPRPAILFSMGQAFRRQYFLDKNPDTLKKAIQSYRDYLVKADQGGRRADAAQALAELEPLLARVEAEGTRPPPVQAKPQTRLMVSSQTDGAEVYLDGTGPVPVPLISEVKPGKHRVRVAAPGFFEEEREVATAEGAVLAVDIPLRERPARLLIQVEAGVDVSIDGRAVGATPLPAPAEVSAGKHLVTLARNGRVALTREVEVGRGESKTIQATMASTGQRRVAWGFLLAGGAGLVTGGVFTAMTFGQQHRANDVLDSKAKGNISLAQAQEFDDARSARDRWRAAAGISYGAGALFGISGLMLFAFDYPSQPGLQTEQPPSPSKPRKEPRSVEVSASPILAPGLSGLRINGRF